MENKNTLRTFQTDNFYLSAFLTAKNFKVISINRENPKRCQFVFPANQKIEKLVHSFLFDSEILIDAKTFANAIKELKTKLYSETRK